MTNRLRDFIRCQLILISLFLSFGSRFTSADESVGVCEEELSRLVKTIEASAFCTYREFVEYRRMFAPFLSRYLAHSKRVFHWVDLGAGLALAQREVLLGKTEVDPSKLRCTAVGVVPPEKDHHSSPESYQADLQKFKEKYSHPVFKYLSGRYFSKLTQKEIGKADLITDYLGVLSYTPHFDQDLEKAMRTLKEGGKLLVALPVDGGSRITFHDDNGSPIPLDEYLGQIKGATLLHYEAQHRGSYEASTVFVIERGKGAVWTPPLELQKIRGMHSPPRSYLWSKASEKSPTLEPN